MSAFILSEAVLDAIAKHGNDGDLIRAEIALQLNRIADLLEAERNGKAAKRTKREPAPMFAADSEPFSLAVEMADAIYDPTELSPKQLQAWARDFDLMLRIDKRERAQIMRAITFATTDLFWSKVILSPRNLRKNWDRIAKATMPIKPGGNGRAFTPAERKDV